METVRIVAAWLLASVLGIGACDEPKAAPDDAGLSATQVDAGPDATATRASVTASASASSIAPEPVPPPASSGDAAAAPAGATPDAGVAGDAGNDGAAPRK